MSRNNISFLKKLPLLAGTTIVTAGVALGAMPTQAFAAEEYTYSVMIYSGDAGTFHGTDGISTTDPDAVIGQLDETTIEVTNISAGEKVYVQAQKAVTEDADSDYIVNGVRLAGHDNENDDAAESGDSSVRQGLEGSFEVTEDMDLVISYTKASDLVEYTVEYETVSGEELAADDTFYGNAGEKPVVGSLYINGYQPQAYNLTKTLSEDSSENVFTFTYTENGSGSSAADRNASDSSTNGDAAEDDSNAETVNASGTDGEPQNLVDLDDDESVPTASGSDTQDGTSILENNHQHRVISLTLAIVAAAICILLILLFGLKKKKENK